MPIDCVVVGAGPAGLAASVALSERQIDHLVLERDRVGCSWRTQRWTRSSSNNPGWMNPMLGPQPSDSFLSAREVVARLDRLAAHCPVREQTDVLGVDRHRDRWLLHTSDGDVVARTLVVASGGENRPRTPGLSRAVPNTIVQRHAADYRSPACLPPGGVVVVGSAQSGCQIAEELSGPDAGWCWRPARWGEPPPGTAAGTPWSGCTTAASSTNDPRIWPTPP